MRNNSINKKNEGKQITLNRFLGRLSVKKIAYLTTSNLY